MYFYSTERPVAEQTKPHSTIYVERPLPAHIQPGMVLGDDDHDTIVRLLARRDQHLQRLYGYIADLNEQLEHNRAHWSISLLRRMRARLGRAYRRILKRPTASR